MNALTATIAIFFAIAPAIGGSAKQPVRAEDIIAEWTSATRSVTSVSGNVEVILYDESFGRISYGQGKFAYFQPCDGFWQVSNTPASSKKARRGDKVGRHRVEDFSPEHFQWHDGYCRIVDDDKKQFSELPASGPKHWFVELLFRAVETVDATSPFLPGLPNKSVVDRWTFEISDESARHVWLHATPKNNTDKKQFASCDLYLRKHPLSLEAVQYVTPGSRQARVVLFSDVELNPRSHERPDLTGYKCLRDSPAKPKAE